MTEERTEATREEFDHHIAVTLGAARARREVRHTYSDWMNANVLAEKLWNGGFRLFKRAAPVIIGRGTGEFYKHLDDPK